MRVGSISFATCVLLMAVSCGDDDGAGKSGHSVDGCTPGQQINCGCLFGGIGVQTCGANGTYKACVCPDSGVGDTSVGLGGAGGVGGFLTGGTAGSAAASGGAIGGGTAGVSGSGAVGSTGGSAGGGGPFGGTGNGGMAGASGGTGGTTSGGGAGGTGGAPDASLGGGGGTTGGAGGNADASTGGSGGSTGSCVTPYTPDRVQCDSVQCNSGEQKCCTYSGAPVCLNAQHTCSSQNRHCDGPEDCGGSPCVDNNTYVGCGTACSSGVFTYCGYGTRSSCVCHSDADCPQSDPYCYQVPCESLPHCWPKPAPVDAGLPSGPPQLPTGPCVETDAGTPPQSGPCGSGTCTSGETCCYDQQTPHCVASASCAYDCDGPEDCASDEFCCGQTGGPGGTFCSGSCGADFVLSSTNHGYICHTDADCPAGTGPCKAGFGYVKYCG